MDIFAGKGPRCDGSPVSLYLESHENDSWWEITKSSLVSNDWPLLGGCFEVLVCRQTVKFTPASKSDSESDFCSDLFFMEPTI